MVQLPVYNVQEIGLNVPPAFPSLQDIVPDGAVGELEVSSTVALNVTDPSTDTVEGFGVTVTVVV